LQLIRKIQYIFDFTQHKTKQAIKFLKPFLGNEIMAEIDLTAPDNLSSRDSRTVEARTLPVLEAAFLKTLRDHSYSLLTLEANLQGAGKNIRSIYVSSCFNGEGKTTIALAMAYALAQSRLERVLLVDWSLKSPSVHRLFGCDIQHGFLDFLLKTDSAGFVADYAVQTAHENFDILPLGNPDLIEKASKIELRDKISQLQHHYGIVVFDGQSLMRSSAAVHSCFVDGTVLVIEAEKTKWEVVQQARNVVEKTGGTIIGAVLNKRKFYIPGFLYGKV
jgi:Mrp family chromosome partitioning ATPase